MVRVKITFYAAVSAKRCHTINSYTYVTSCACLRLLDLHVATCSSRATPIHVLVLDLVASQRLQRSTAAYYM